ncbi:Lipid A biosynthesis lauroyltransferase [compost metagenome]
MLGLETGAPVLPALCVREPDLTHRLVMEAPVLLREQFGRKQQTEAMALLNRRLEEQLLKHPEQWFYWFNVHERFAGDRRQEGE